MRRPAKLAVKILVLGCFACMPAVAQPKSAQPKGETPTAGMYPEVRLRKLHLVRPDLIPYPIMFEVCC
jgi:hypothetical protein